MSKKILIIPHHPESSGVKVRLKEFAEALSSDFKVTLLHWGAVEGKYNWLT